MLAVAGSAAHRCPAPRQCWRAAVVLSQVLCAARGCRPARLGVSTPSRRPGGAPWPRTP